MGTAPILLAWGDDLLLIEEAVAALGAGIPRQTWAAPWRFVVLGGLLAAYFVLMFWVLQTAAAVPTAAVFTLTPVMAAGFGWLLLGQVTTARMVTALTIGAAFNPISSSPILSNLFK